MPMAPSRSTFLFIHAPTPVYRHPKDSDRVRSKLNIGIQRFRDYAIFTDLITEATTTIELKSMYVRRCLVWPQPTTI